MKSAKDLVAASNRDIHLVSSEEAAKLVGDPSVIFVDVQENDEFRKPGKVQGAMHVPRGFLERKTPVSLLQIWKPL